MDSEAEKRQGSASFKFDTSTSKRDILYKSLEAERANRFKITLFDTLIKLEGSDNKRKISRERLILTYLSLFIKKIQLLSIILISFETSDNVTLESSFNVLLRILRFDILSISLNIQLEFLLVMIGGIWGLCISFCMIYLQIFYKRKIALRPVLFLTSLLGWIFKHVFCIPYLYSVGIFVKYTFFDDNSEVGEYDNVSASNYKTFLALPLVFGVPILALNIYFRTIYYCNPCYTAKIKRNRMHSLVTLKDNLFQFIIVFASFYRSAAYFNILCVIISIYMISQYIFYMPYVAMFDNVFEVDTWTMVLFGVIAYQISIYINTNSVRALIMIFIYPCITFITYFLMNWYFDRALNFPITNPYNVELKIRRLIFGKKPRNFQHNLSEKIKTMYKDATKIFLSFKMLFVWESLFYLHYERNKSLSLLKLSKINFSSRKHLKIWYQLHRNKARYYSFPNLEAEYLYYFYYKMLVNEEFADDLTLIRYIKDINVLNRRDLEVTCDLWDVYRKLSEISEHSLESINEACTKLVKSKKKFEEKAEKMVRKYHSDPAVLSVYGSYKADFLEQNQGNLLLQRSRSLKGSKDTGIEKITGMKYRQGDAIMVVSGMHGTIGDILYLNNEIAKLLNIDCVDDYIGTTFRQFIPAPFDVMHNDILRRGLIFGERIELYRPSLFLITTRGHCVEVTMHFRLVFFKQIPYFIADFNEKGYNTNLILHSPDGYIYAASKNINQLIGNRKGTVFEVVNNLANYYENYNPGVPFEYHEDFDCFMMRITLVIDGSPLVALYVANDYEYFAQMNNSDENTPKPHHVESFNDGGYKTDITMEPEELNLKSGLASSFTYASTVLSKMEKKYEKGEKESSKIARLCNSMNVNVRISNAALLGIIIATIIIERYVVNELKISNFLSNFSTLRHLGNSILLDSRSLDLLSKGYELAYEETDYRASLQSSINNFENTLLQVSDEISNYDYMDDVFVTKKVKTTEKTGENALRIIKTNLFQALQKIIQEGYTIYGAELSGFQGIQASLFYIYWNFPGETFRSLNSSLNSINDETHNHISSVFEFLKIFKLIVFIPSMLIIILSIPNLIALEKINKEHWNELSSLNIERQIALREKLTVRLSEFHGIQVEEIEPKHTKKAVYSSIWKTFLFKVLFLELISIIYFFVSIYAIQNSISEALTYQSSYRLRSGYRRSLTISTFFWTRELLLSETESSLINTLDNKNPYPSVIKSLQSSIEDYDYHEHLIDFGSATKYFEHDMYNLLIGNPCSDAAKSIPNCLTSYISTGMLPALELYLDDTRTIFFDNSSNWQDVIKLEKYSKLISNSVGLMTESFMNSTDDKIDAYMTYLTITTLLYFFILLLVVLLLVLASVNKIKNGLIGKIEILNYF
ncbi:unnamed protein product [Blepharisma stoltei]|uniref:Uncharacterized protein n=1 Tax=Blepharisma stoltei TaxID=1481888 RepID=A0AAU9JGW7_9CILI|nr:unnamed protein product [Blepharisma stoltei]